MRRCRRRQAWSRRVALVLAAEMRAFRRACCLSCARREASRIVVASCARAAAVRFASGLGLQRLHVTHSALAEQAKGSEARSARAQVREGRGRVLYEMHELLSLRRSGASWRGRRVV